MLKPKHDYMVNLVKIRDDLKRQLSYELDLIEKERLAQIDSLKTQEGIIEPEIKRSREKVLDLDKVQNELDRLKEEEQNVSTTLQGLRKQLQSYDLVNSDEGAFSILEPGHASMGGAPISPRRTKMVMNGLLIGLALGVGIVYLLHRLDDRLEIAEDIEDALEEPVLGQIPLVDTKTSVDGRVLITRLHQHDMFAESVRGVRSAVLLGATKEHPRRVLLISSAVPGDGKTTFTVNFAATLAMASHRVLLIDADLRRGNVHAYFGQQREEGLSEVLAGDVHWTDVRKESELPNLHFISTGAIPSSPGELLISPIMTHLLEEVRKEYDYVIIDCPPLTALDDTFTLLPISDGIVFVVRAGQTSIRFARTALQTARQRGATVIGLVLNGITADNPYYYYNYYYHSYYNKGQAATVAEGGTVAVKTPGSKMPDPKRSPGRPMSIDVVAQARAIGHRPASSQVNEAERSKAQDYKARRAGSRLPILPKPETPVAPAGETVPPLPVVTSADQNPPPAA